VWDERRREFLRHAQRDDGSWAAYWWEDDEYATALAAEALAATGRPDDRPRVESAVRWTLARIGQDGAAAGSPFATAWCVRILHLAADAAAVREQRARSVAWLMHRQEPDGGWPASARLVAPRPDVTDRAASPVPPAASLDEARTFTTATVLSALTRSIE
jgi:squalene cyclase